MTSILKNKKRNREWEACCYGKKKSEIYVALRVMSFGTFMKFLNCRFYYSGFFVVYFYSVFM